jgi:hypothetical protein
MEPTGPVKDGGDSCLLEIEILEARDEAGMRNFAAHHVGRVVPAILHGGKPFPSAGAVIEVIAEYRGSPRAGGRFHLSPPEGQ